MLIGNEKLNNLLKENKTFCMMPWIHMYVHTDGSVYPCCDSFDKKSLVLGNVQKNSLEEIWNGDEYKNLRKSMLNGEESSICNNCYVREKNSSDIYSMRFYANSGYSHHFDLVKDTADDGYLPHMNLKYFDVRFSNVCNFKCRYCGEEYSSSWAAENKQHTNGYKLPVIRHASNEHPYLMEQLKVHLDGMEEIYFAGGEPLIMSEHYEILEYLIEKNRTDVVLRYNTNISKLGLGNKSVIELWKHFPRIHLLASLDSFGSRAEYMRSGTKWDEILYNIKLIKKELPDTVEVGFNCVISCFNVLTLTDFIDHLLEHNIVSHNSTFTLYPLTHPYWYNINILSKDLRQVAHDKLEKYLTKLDKSSKLYNVLNSHLNFINPSIETNLEHILQFIHYNDRLDNIRKERFIDTFPELSEWYLNIKQLYDVS
jgi:radical SAM protein with 4Fe4S-binding SPASM domain